jgi:hypothetical protein
MICKTVVQESAFETTQKYKVSTMERRNVIFSGSKKYRYGLIIDKCQSHNTPSLILKIDTLPIGHRWCAPAVAREVA